LNEAGLPFDNESGFAARDLRGLDRWETFTVSATLTLVGALTAVGRYRIVGRLCQFQNSLIAATSIATTAGTSFVVLPITAVTGIAGMAVMTNDTTNIAVGVCHIDVATSRCYLPSQVASGDLFNVAGWYEI
jgi:hypothetical protein